MIGKLCTKNNESGYKKVQFFVVSLLSECVSAFVCEDSHPPSGQYTGQPVDVPQNHKRNICDLTVADRLALYDHVISILSQQKEASACSSQDDLYVDLVSKLQKGKTS